VIQLRRPSQYSFGDGLIAEQTSELWEPWMRQADKVLEDEQLISVVYEGLLKRHAKSRTRGRLGVPAEIVLRMLLLKHIRNWSFAVVEREVRTNLVYREFTRVGASKVPDARTLGRQARALGPEVIKQIHERMVALALENKVIQGRRMRVDTTVVETNIHYPTDSSLLGDGTRVSTRLMKKVTSIAGETGTKLRDRMRSMQRNVIRKGKASKPTEFGKMIKVQEAENQIVIDYEVYDKKPNDTDLLVPAIERHETLTSRTPELVAADNGFFSAKNEAAAHEKGVKRVSIPNRSTKSEARRQTQKKRWFKKGQKWRTGCEGRISLLKRRHGLRRSLYKGETGMKRWVGLGIIGDNLINIGRVMAE
jgi:IS5 family transposase